MDRPIKPDTHVKHPYSYLIRSMLLGLLLLVSSVFSSYAMSTNFFGVAGDNGDNQVEAATASGNWVTYRATSYAGGSGTSSSPYKISTAAQLARMVYQPSTGVYMPYESEKYYILTNNIDLGAHFWIPIGNIYFGGGSGLQAYQYAWTGHFDGCGYTISYLRIEASTSGKEEGAGLLAKQNYGAKYNYAYAGLFGLVTNKSYIKNVNLKYVYIDTHAYAIGALVGAVYCSGTMSYSISNCTVNGGYLYGNSLAFSSYKYQVGGMIGYIGPSRTMSYTGPTSDTNGSSYCDTRCLGVSSVYLYAAKGYAGGVVGSYRTSTSSYSNDFYFNGSMYGYYGIGGLCAISSACQMYRSYYLLGSAVTYNCSGVYKTYTASFAKYSGSFAGEFIGNFVGSSLTISGYSQNGGTVVKGNTTKTVPSLDDVKTGETIGDMTTSYKSINNTYPISAQWIRTTTVTTSGQLSAAIELEAVGSNIQSSLSKPSGSSSQTLTITTYGTSEFYVTYSTVNSNVTVSLTSSSRAYSVASDFSSTVVKGSAIGTAYVGGMHTGTRTMTISGTATSKTAYLKITTPASSYGYVWVEPYVSVSTLGGGTLTSHKSVPGNLASISDKQYSNTSTKGVVYRLPASTTVTFSVPFVEYVTNSGLLINNYRWFNVTVIFSISTSGTNPYEDNYISAGSTYGDYSERFDGWKVTTTSGSTSTPSTSFSFSSSTSNYIFKTTSGSASTLSTMWTQAYAISNSTLYYETSSAYDTVNTSILYPDGTTSVSISSSGQAITLPTYVNSQTLTVKQYFSDSTGATGKYAIAGTTVYVQISTSSSSTSKWYLSRIVFPGNENLQYNDQAFGNAVSYTVTDHVTASTGRSNYFMAYVYKYRTGIKLQESYGGTMTLTITDSAGSTTKKTVTATNSTAQVMALWDDKITISYSNSQMTDQPITTQSYADGRLLGIYSSTGGKVGLWSYGPVALSSAESYYNQGKYDSMSYSRYFYINRENMYTQTVQYANSSGVTSNSVTLTLTNGSTTVSATANQSATTKYLYCVASTTVTFSITLSDANRSYCTYSYTTNSGGTNTGNIQASSTLLSNDSLGSRARTYKGTFYTQYYYLNLQHNSTSNLSNTYLRYSTNGSTWTTLTPNSSANTTKIGSLQYGQTVYLYVSTSSTSNVAPNMAKITNSYTYAVWGIYRDSDSTSGGGKGVVSWEDTAISSSYQTSFTISTTTANKNVFDESPADGAAKKKYSFYSENLSKINYVIENPLGLTNVGGVLQFVSGSTVVELSASKPVVYMYWQLNPVVQLTAINYSQNYVVDFTLGPDTENRNPTFNLVTSNNGVTSTGNLPWILFPGFMTFGADAIFKYSLSGYTVKTEVKEEAYSSTNSNLNSYSLSYNNGATTVSGQKAATSKSANGGTTASVGVSLNAYNNVKQYYALITVKVDGTNVITNQKLTTDTSVSYKHTYGFTVTFVIEFCQNTWDRTVSSGPTISNNTITIANTTDYAKFCYGATVSGNNYSGITVNITADLDVSKYYTQPIGSTGRYGWSSAPALACTINGNGHTISGIRILMIGYNVSWIPYASSSFVLKNLIVKNYNITQGNSGVAGEIGGLVGDFYGTISNVGVLNPTVVAYGGSTVGGFVSNLYNGVIENSYIAGGSLTSGSGRVGVLFDLVNTGTLTVRNTYTNVSTISTSGEKYLMGHANSYTANYSNCYAVGNGSISFRTGNGSASNCMVINGTSSETVTKATTTQGRDMSFAMNTAGLDMQNVWCYMGQGVTNGTYNTTIKQPDYGYPVLTGFMGCGTGNFVINKVVNSSEGYNSSTETGYTIAPHKIATTYKYNITAIPQFTVKQNSAYNETYGSIKNIKYGSVNVSTITSFDTNSNSAYKYSMTTSGLTVTVTFEAHRLTINTDYSSLFASASKYVIVWWNGANTITQSIKNSLINTKDIIIGAVRIAGTNVSGYNNKTLYEYHDNGLDKTISQTVGSGTKTVTTSGGNSSVSCRSTNVQSDETYTLTPYVGIKLSLQPDSLNLSVSDVLATITSNTAGYVGNGDNTYTKKSVTKTFSPSAITDRNAILLYTYVDDTTSITVTSQSKVNGGNYVSGGELPKAILTSIDYPTFTSSSGATSVTMVGDTANVSTGTESDYTRVVSKSYTQIRGKHTSGEYNGVPMIYVANGTTIYKLNYSMASNAVEFVYSETAETATSVTITANEAVKTKTVTISKSNPSALLTIPFGSDGNINYKLTTGSGKVYLMVLKDENGSILKSTYGTGTLSIDYATTITAGRRFYINVYEYFAFSISANQTLSGDYTTSNTDTLSVKGITSRTAPSNADYSGKDTISVNSKTYYVYGTVLSLSSYLNKTGSYDNEAYLNEKYSVYSTSDSAGSNKVSFSASARTANVTLTTTHSVTVNYKVNTLTVLLERSNSLAEIPVLIPYSEKITYNGVDFTERVGGVKLWLNGQASVSGKYVYTFATDNSSSMVINCKYINTITLNGKKIMSFDSSKSSLGSSTLDSSRAYAYTIAYGESVRFLRGDDDSVYKANVFAVTKTGSNDSINTYSEIRDTVSDSSYVNGIYIGLKTKDFSYPAAFNNTIKVNSTFSVTYWPLFQLTVTENFDLVSQYAIANNYKANGTYTMYRTNDYATGYTININNVNSVASSQWATFAGNKSSEGYWIKIVYTPRSSDINNFDYANMTISLYDTTIGVGQTKTITLTNYGSPSRTVYAKLLKNGNNYELYFNLLNAYNYDVTTDNGVAEHIFVYNLSEKVYTFNARYLIDSATPNATPATIQILEYKDAERQITPIVRTTLTNTSSNVSLQVGALAVMSYKVSSLNTTLYNAPTSITTSDGSKLSVGGTIETMNWIFDVTASGATVTANFTSKFTLAGEYQIQYVTTGYNNTQGELSTGTTFGTYTLKVNNANYVAGNRFTYGSPISISVSAKTNYIVKSITFYNASNNAVLKSNTTSGASMSLTLDSATCNVKIVVVYGEKEYTISAGIQIYKGSATDGAKVMTSSSNGVASIDSGRITMTVTSNHKTASTTKVGALGSITMSLSNDSSNTSYIYKGTVATSITPTSTGERSVVFTTPTNNVTITAKYNRLLSLSQPTSNFVTTTNPSSSRIDYPQATVTGTPSRTIGTSNYYEWGSTITFHANNKTGWTFAWSPSSLSGDNPTTTITDSTANGISITYTETTKELTLKSQIDGAGTVAIVGHTLKNNPSTTSTNTTTGIKITVGYFSTVTLRATANTGYRFNVWTESVSGYITTGSRETTIPINSKMFDTNLTITANWIMTHTYSIPTNFDARDKNNTSSVLIGAVNSSLYIAGTSGAQASSITVDTNSNVTFMAKRLITVNGKTYRFSHFAQGTSYTQALSAGGNIVSIGSSSLGGTFDTLTIKANATTQATQYHAIYIEYVQIRADSRDLNRNGTSLGAIINASISPNNSMTIDGVSINRWQNNSGLIDVNSSVTLSAPSIGGYRFAGWKTDLASTSYLSSSSSYNTGAISKATTYYAIYIKQFTVSTDSIDVDHATDDSGAVQSLGVPNITGSGTFDEKGSTTLSAPATYSKNGVNYRFIGWKASYNASTFLTTSTTYTVSNITASSTYYACYKMQLTLTVTVKDSNNAKDWSGIQADSLRITIGGKAYVLSDDFTITIDYGTTISDINISIVYNKSGRQTYRLLSLVVTKNGNSQVTNPSDYVISTTIPGWNITANSIINITTIQTYLAVNSANNISTTATYYTKGIAITPSNSVHVDSAGLNYDGSTFYDKGTRVTYTANAITGYSFSGWTIEGAKYNDMQQSFVLGNNCGYITSVANTYTELSYTDTVGAYLGENKAVLSIASGPVVEGDNTTFTLNIGYGNTLSITTNLVSFNLTANGSNPTSYTYTRGYFTSISVSATDNSLDYSWDYWIIGSLQYNNKTTSIQGQVLIGNTTITAYYSSLYYVSFATSTQGATSSANRVSHVALVGDTVISPVKTYTDEILGVTRYGYKENTEITVNVFIGSGYRNLGIKKDGLGDYLTNNTPYQIQGSTTSYSNYNVIFALNSDTSAHYVVYFIQRITVNVALDNGGTNTATITSNDPLDESITDASGKIVGKTVDYNSTITVSVTNNDTNVQFVAWYNSANNMVSQSTTYSAKATVNETYTARYENLYKYTFTVETTGNANAGNKITYVASEEAIRGGYRAGVTLTVSIAVASGYSFRGTYHNSALFKDSNTWQFTIVTGPDTAGEYIAKFVQLVTLTVNTMPNGIGNKITITGGAGASGTNTASITVDYGTSMTISSDATIGYYNIDGIFDGGNRLNSTNTYTFVIQSNRTLTVQYQAVGRNLIITGLGSITLSSTEGTVTYSTGRYSIGNFTYNATVAPDSYNKFEACYIDGSLYSTNTSFTITMIPSGQVYTDIEIKFSSITWANSDMRASAYAGGDGSESNPYLISNASQIGLLAYNTAKGTDYAGKYFALTGNIDMSGAYHMPIRDFAGHIDGKDYRIYNVSIMGYSTVFIDDLAGDSSENYARAFISSTKPGATISSVTIEGTVVENTTGMQLDVNSRDIHYNMAGGLIAYAKGETYVSEVIVDMDITVDKTTDTDWVVGGLVGLSQGRLGIYACAFDGSMTVNIGVSQRTNYALVGGLVGYTTDRLAISQSAKRGGNITVSAQNGTTYNGAILGASLSLEGDSIGDVVNIYDVYSTAVLSTISGTVYTGLIGYSNGEIDGALNLGSVLVDSSSLVVYSSGIMGMTDITAKNAYFRNSISSSGEYVGTSLSDNDLKDKTKMTLKFGAPWSISTGSYPVLAKLDINAYWYHSAISGNNGIYEVSSAAELAYIFAHMPTSGEIALTNDIDMSGYLWWATDIPAGITFNGRGYTISNMTLVNNAFVGVNRGTIKQVVFKDAGLVIDNYFIDTRTYHSIVCSYNAGTMYKVIVEGNITIQSLLTDSTLEVGGIVGRLDGNATLSKSSFNGTISYYNFHTQFVTDNSYTNADPIYMGGAVGYIGGGNIDQVYANPQFKIFTFGYTDDGGEVVDKDTGEVITPGSNVHAYEQIRVGGLIGSAQGITITNSYSNTYVDIVQVGNLDVGSLIGYVYAGAVNNISYAYSQSVERDDNMVGKYQNKSTGYIADNSTLYGTGDGGHSYYDVVGVNEDQGWDFEDIWYFSDDPLENYGAPMLRNANNDHEIEVIIHNNGTIQNLVTRQDGSKVIKAPHMADTNFVVTFIPDTNWNVYIILLDGVQQTTANLLDMGKVDDEHTIEVTFRLTSYTFSTEVLPDDSYGTIVPTIGPDMDGIPNAPGYYDYGTQITLTAKDNGVDTVFGYWMVNGVRLDASTSTYTIGKDENGYGTISFVMNGTTATKYTAVFDKQYPVNVNVVGPSGVDVSTVGTAGVTREPDRQPNLYLNGSTINIDIQAYYGYQFDHVTLGSTVISSNSIYTISEQGADHYLLTFTLSQSTSGTYTVYFIKKQYKVTVDIGEGLDVTSITTGGNPVTLNEDNEFLAEYLDTVVVNYNVQVRYRFDANHGTYLWNNNAQGTVTTTSYSSPQVTGESTLALEAQRLYWDDLEVIENITLSGKGTDAEPYIVASAAGYGKMIDMINASDQEYNKSVFSIRADAIGDQGNVIIDLNARFVRPIGTADHPFEGKILGQGYLTGANYSTLYNMYGIQEESTFIGTANGAVIDGLAIDNMNLDTDSVGYLFAKQVSSTIVSNINILSGNLNALSGAVFVGVADKSSAMYQIGIDSDVAFTVSAIAQDYVSGFVIENRGLIQNSYSYAKVDIADTGYANMNVASIAWINQGIIKNVVSNLTGNTKNSHYMVNTNQNYAQVLDSYYIKNYTNYVGIATNKSGAIDGTNVLGSGIAQLTSSYPTLNFAQIWGINDGASLPYLNTKKVNSSETTVTPQVTNNTVNISSAIQLYSVAKLIAQGNATYNNADTAINIINSIDMSGYEMIPIGTEQYPFVGKFNGNYYEISNVYIDYVNDNTANVGLFGVVGGNAEIKNVVVSSSMIAGQNNVGIIAKVQDNAFIHGVRTLSNTYTKGTIIGTTNVGLIGEVVGSNATILNIGNDIDIVATNSNAGIVGKSSSLLQSVYNIGSIMTNSNLGGIVGYSDQAVVVSNGYNRGTLYGTTTAIGQIASHNYMLAESSGKLHNVYSYNQYVDTSILDSNIKVRIISDTQGAITSNVSEDQFVVFDNTNNIFVNSYDFDFENIWSYMDGTNDNMPILRYFYSRVITVTYNEYGTVEPDGDDFGYVYVLYGTNISFTFLPIEHYHTGYIEVDGTRIDGVGNNYTFTNVVADHTLNVVFEIDTYEFTWTAQLRTKAYTDDLDPAITDITTSMVMSGAGTYPYTDYSYMDNNNQVAEMPRNVTLRVNYDSSIYRFLGILHNGTMIDPSSTYDGTNILIFKLDQSNGVAVLSMHANDTTGGDYVAVFTKHYTLTIKADPANYGKVAITEGENNGTEGWYDHGTNITVTATPYYENDPNHTGTQFVHWIDENGNVVSNDISYSFIITHTTNLTAVFELITLNVTMNIGYQSPDTEMPRVSDVLHGTVKYQINTGEIVDVQNGDEFGVTYTNTLRVMITPDARMKIGELVVTGSSYTTATADGVTTVTIDYMNKDTSFTITFTQDLWTDHAASSIANVSGSTYTIMTAEELAYVAKMGVGWSINKTFILGADINLDKYYWKPMTIQDVTFDGKYHTISNLRVLDFYNLGLLGDVVNSTVKNIKIKDASVDISLSVEDYTKNNNRYGNIGIISASSTSTIFTNCYILSGSITNTVGLTGGIVGFPNNGTLIENCINYANITPAQSASSRVGGIAGFATNTYITKCINYGNIADGSGIVGCVAKTDGGANATLRFPKEKEFTVDQCINFGTVSSNAMIGFQWEVNAVIVNNANYGTAQGFAGVGGGMTVKYNLNAGNISAWGGNSGIQSDNYSVNAVTDGVTYVTELTEESLPTLDFNREWIIYNGDNLANYNSEYLTNYADLVGTPIPRGAVIVGDWNDFVTDADAPASNNGVYEISSPSELAWLSKKVQSDASYTNGKSFVLANDVDMFGRNFTSISTFNGGFDGQNHNINYLYIDASHPKDDVTGTMIGLFASVNSTLPIQNVTMINPYVQVYRKSFETTIYVGTLGGCVTANTSNIRILGGSVDIICDEYTHLVIGGVIGESQNGSTNTLLYSNINLFTSTQMDYGTSHFSHVGGIIGSMSGNLLESAYTGNITCDVFRNIGGLVGDIGSDSTIDNAYVIADIYYNQAYGYGSIVGGYQDNSPIISNVYTVSNIQPGLNTSILYNCLTTYGSYTDVGKIETVTSEELKDYTTFDETWDFTKIWSYVKGENDGYPVLTHMYGYSTITISVTNPNYGEVTLDIYNYPLVLVADSNNMATYTVDVVIGNNLTVEFRATDYKYVVKNVKLDGVAVDHPVELYAINTDHLIEVEFALNMFKLTINMSILADEGYTVPDGTKIVVYVRSVDTNKTYVAILANGESTTLYNLLIGDYVVSVVTPMYFTSSVVTENGITNNISMVKHQEITVNAVKNDEKWLHGDASTY